MDGPYASELTKDQMFAFIQLKQQISDQYGPEKVKDEYRLIRFLRARDFDVVKAGQMLRNHLEWRKKYHIDTIIEDFTVTEVFLKYFPLSKPFLDKDGDLAAIFWFGNMDSKGILKSGKRSDFLNTVYQRLENDTKYMEELSKKDGKCRQQWTYILDFDNFSFAQATHKEALELYLIFFAAYEANYPERLKVGYIINASIYFTMVYSLIKPLLAEATVRKLRIFGRDGWKEELKQIIDPDVLPAYLGGNRTDPDGNPHCLSLVNIGGRVSEHYYLSTKERKLAILPGVKKFNISRMSRITIELSVPLPGSEIEWEFETESHDIGFGLRYSNEVEPEKKSEVLIPVQRVDTKIFSETGMFRCHNAGVYYLVFDNAFSWLRSKELYCRAHIVSPNGDKTCVTK